MAYEKETNLKETEFEIVEGKSKDRLTTGIILIIIGLVALVGQLLPEPELGMYIVPALGVIFLVWGVLNRQVGLLIPGGILSGIGLGIVVNEQLLAGMELSGEATGGIFMLSFALGWGVITLFSALFTARTHWWPLIPGGIMAVIGAALLAGGTALRALEMAGKGWPVILIVLGLYIIWRRR